MKNFYSVLVTTLIAPLTIFAGVKRATYEVPTSQVDLKAAATFSIEQISVNRVGDNIMIRYLVPQELTGEPNLIEFSGTMSKDSAQLTSPDGDLDCLTTRRQMMCTVEYQKIRFDQEKAQQLMTGKFKGEELLKRMAVQERFSTDPIGIIRISFSR